MAIKLSVGLQKKIGQPDYGSLGASCHVEFEIDSILLDGDLNGFHQKVHDAFAACQQAVNDQLSQQQSGQPHSHGNGQSQATNGNGHTNGHANGHQARRSNGRSATQSQVRAIHAIANRQRIDLPGELSNRFGVQRPDDLDIRQASEFIDAIKPQNQENGNGNGERR